MGPLGTAPADPPLFPTGRPPSRVTGPPGSENMLNGTPLEAGGSHARASSSSAPFPPGRRACCVCAHACARRHRVEGRGGCVCLRNHRAPRRL